MSYDATGFTCGKLKAPGRRHKALRARAGGGLRLHPVWSVRAAVGEMGGGRRSVRYHAPGATAIFFPTPPLPVLPGYNTISTVQRRGNTGYRPLGEVFTAIVRMTTIC